MSSVPSCKLLSYFSCFCDFKSIYYFYFIFVIGFSSESSNLINMFECTGAIYQQYFIPHTFCMFHALQCNFNFVSASFSLQGWSHDNPYNTSMFVYTDDIHPAILSSISVFLRRRLSAFQCNFCVNLTSMIAWSRDPNNFFKLHCHI